MKRRGLLFFASVLLSLCLAGAMVACTSTKSSVTYNPGTYTAKAAGMNGDVTVEVTVSGNAIQSIAVVKHSETPGISDPAIERIPAAIVDGQTLAVDGIAGATMTSNAIMAAVEDCLTQAGADIAALKVPGGKKAAAKKLVAEKADVIIIGGGGAGMSAAVAAAENGASVIVIEKTAILGGNTILAGGGYNAVDLDREHLQKITAAQIKSVQDLLAKPTLNPLHTQLRDILKADFDAYLASGETYLFDSEELHALQTYDAGDYLGNLELIYKLAEESPVTMNQLADMGLVWKDFTLTYVGALWPRSHEARDYKSGIGFIEIYSKVINANNYPVEILREVKADEFIMKGNRVVGVKATGADGTPYEFTANKGVILASGGFGANVEMREKYNTQWATLDASIKTSNSPAITGDGIVMAQNIGANVIDMNLIQLLPTCDPQTGAASGYVGQATAMFINKNGVRFVNELERRDNLVKAALEQPGSMFYLITNEKNNYLDAQGVNKFGQHVDDLIAQGKVFKADTIEELARKIGVPPQALASSVEKFNQASRTNVDPEFGRNSFADNILLTAGGPYYAIPRQPAVHHTMGGVQIDTDTHVLKADGTIIPGLYAAGEVTGGIHGGNRIGANAVPDALTYGRIAGVNVSQGK
ncbi:flavocytochrome c [Breznakiella homolactica]|uniref:Urocanate reductase n=1 Tax=Breznakiella homolactica TaxID=2798577 RepID=A0A7T7XLQ7_9SPIR|nr:flavocytochrome c [Breznakiella homolactica]QQO08573.1 flavocytochrome c [Breznakiella homolactica]